MESSRLNNEIFCPDGTNNASQSTFVDNAVIPKQLPMYMLDSRHNIVFSPKSPLELYNLVLQKISKLNGIVVETKILKLTIKAFLPHTIPSPRLSSITIKFKVYSDIMNDEKLKLSVLYMQCRGGDLFEYNKIFHVFQRMCSQSESMDDSIIVPTTNDWNSSSASFVDFDTIVSSLSPQELSEKKREWFGYGIKPKMSDSESMDESKSVATTKEYEEFWKIELLP